MKPLLLWTYVTGHQRQQSLIKLYWLHVGGFSSLLHTDTISLRFHHQNDKSKSDTAWTVVWSLLVNDLGNSATHMTSSALVKTSHSKIREPVNNTQNHCNTDWSAFSDILHSALSYEVLMGPCGLMDLSLKVNLSSRRSSLIFPRTVSLSWLQSTRMI